MTGAESFQAEYRPLSAQSPGWGTIARLPWDEAIFGFPVADLVFGDTLPGATAVPDFRALLTDFCRVTGAALVSAQIAATNTAAQAFLAAAGFIPVDFSLVATRYRLNIARLPEPRFPFRPATPDDHAAILSISGRAFEFGRYHTDPRFPRMLANRRYVEWIQRALSSNDPNERVFVLGGPGKVIAFMHVLIHGGRADLRLGAADPDNEIGFAGFSLYAETLRALQKLSVSTVSAKISASNTRVLNIFATLEFHFSCPRVTLHWHAPNALGVYCDT